MLKHLVKIYLKENNFSEAILVQQKLVKLNPKERVFLLELYIQNKNQEKALSLMKTMEQENVLSARYQRIKNNFNQKKEPLVSEEKSPTEISLESQFTTNKSFFILKKILEKNKANPSLLIKYSNEGILLFPAQPFVYLMRGKALNDQKKYKMALLCLKNGIDFVVAEDMEITFFKEIAISYRGLGSFKEEKKYIEKSKKKRH
jgi:tetratricopeptide (TPR) repeat protein